VSLTETIARRRVALGFLAAIATVLLARPTPLTWWIGLVVATVGEAIRIWAAGHLEKGREITQSGPYRWSRHPLYVGSSIIAAGIVIASRSVPVGVVTAFYMGATITAAIRTEEAFLTDRFGDAYDRYRESGGDPMPRRFSVARAIRNREYRAVAGLAAGFALLALRMIGYL
jgi:protein-S-isoprenylcysteine O-methyltransferase Ste14